MKALSIKEPFASLVSLGIKRIETRSWKTNYRGEIYIHASLTKNKMEKERREKLLKLLPKDYDFKEGYILCKACLKVNMMIYLIRLFVVICSWRKKSVNLYTKFQKIPAVAE